MNDYRSPKSEYKIGGSLDSTDPLYVRRQADRELYEALKAGEFCYVLNCRQMGKSSLRVRTMKRLVSEEIVGAEIDLTLMGSTGVTVLQWYGGLIRSLVNSLHLEDFRVAAWLKKHRYLSPIQCLSEFIETVLLVRVKQNIVIFIDEIDSVLGLEFSLDDFFAWIRGIYERRSQNPDLKRLTFCLLGVATPGDLIADKRRTPFNIGKAIALNGFSLSEAQPLLLGLQDIDNPQEILQEILFWTGGQPFLTQKLCQLIRETGSKHISTNKHISIKQIVREKIIDNWEAQDEPEHLKTIRDRIVRSDCVGRLLGLYQEILDKNSIVADGSSEQTDLKLSGLVVQKNYRLVVNNPVYRAVFDRQWLEGEFAKLRPYGAAIAAWVDSGCQDESRLLRGQALQEVLTWAGDKSLSNIDYQYLNTSQEVDRQETQRNLQLERETLARKAYRTRTIFATAFGIVALIVAFAANNLRLAAKRSQLQAERQELTALVKTAAALLESDRQLTALIEAVGAGKKLQQASWRKDAAEIERELQDILQQGIYWQKKKNRLSASDDRLWDVSFSPDGKTMVSGGINLRLWQRNGNLLQIFAGDGGQIFGTSFSPDGELIAGASSNNIVRLWNKNGELLHTLTGHSNWVRDVDFSPDGELIASGSRDKTIKLWRKDGSLINTLTGHRGEVLSVNFSPDGELIASGSNDRTVKLWNLQGELLDTFDGLEGHQDEVWDVDFSPDGELIISASRDRTIKLWRRDGSLINTFEGHTDGVLSASFSPDGQTIASAGYDKTVKLWNLQGQAIDNFKGHSFLISSVKFSPDGKLLASAGDNSALLWSLDRDRQQTFVGHRNWIFSLGFSPDGKRLASAGRDNTINIWDEKGQLLHSLNGATAHKSAIWDLSFSPDGEILASAGNDRRIKLWSKDGELLHTLKGSKGHRDAVYGVAFSPDGEILASAGKDGRVILWDNEGKYQQTLVDDGVNRYEALNVNFSPDGELIAAAGSDRTVKLWSRKGELLHTFKGHKNKVWDVVFSPDGELIASASDDRTVKIWSKKGKLLHTLKGHQDFIWSLGFSPDGKAIASASKDGTVKLWSREGKLLHTIDGYRGEIWAVGFQPQRNKLAFAGSDNNVILLNLDYLQDLDGLLELGCSWLHDYLKHNRESDRQDICK